MVLHHRRLGLAPGATLGRRGPEGLSSAAQALGCCRARAPIPGRERVGHRRLSLERQAFCFCAAGLVEKATPPRRRRNAPIGRLHPWRPYQTPSVMKNKHFFVVLRTDARLSWTRGSGIAAAVRVGLRPPSRVDVEDERTTPKIALLP
jgi:hypothetical protein